ncbi:MAG: putative signal transducing protein [Massilia sp.]
MELVPGRDLVIAGQFLRPIDAQIAHGRLAAAGIPAVVADACLAQAYEVMSAAMGGVRVLVPQAHLAEAAEVLAALERGDFALPDEGDEA